MSVIADIRGAFALLTILPVAPRGQEPSPRIVAWFPWVGLLMGSVAFGLVALADFASVTWGDGGFIGRASWMFATAVVGVWALLTRLLHWDGLADVADGWWGGATTERRLEIMADSTIGAFGATVVALVLFAQVSALAVLVDRMGYLTAVLAVPAFGRAAAMFGAWLGKPARPGGLGSSVAGKPSLGGILVAAIGLSLAGAVMLLEFGTAGLVWSVAAFVVAAAVPHALASRFGGITGDVLGASVIVTETIALVTAACMVVW